MRPTLTFLVVSTRFVIIDNVYVHGYPDMITDQGSGGELEGAQAILLAVIAKVDLNPFSRQNT